MFLIHFESKCKKSKKTIHEHLSSNFVEGSTSLKTIPFININSNIDGILNYLLPCRITSAHSDFALRSEEFFGNLV